MSYRKSNTEKKITGIGTIQERMDKLIAETHGNHWRPISLWESTRILAEVIKEMQDEIDKLREEVKK